MTVNCVLAVVLPFTLAESDCSPERTAVRPGTVKFPLPSVVYVPDSPVKAALESKATLAPDMGEPSLRVTVKVTLCAVCWVRVFGLAFMSRAVSSASRLKLPVVSPA